MASGEFNKLYSKWFEAPIPPKGQSLMLPMSDCDEGPRRIPERRAHAVDPEPPRDRCASDSANPYSSAAASGYRGCDCQSAAENIDATGMAALSSIPIRSRIE